MSIQEWRGHDQEATRGEAGGHRITRHVKHLGRFSRVRPPWCPRLRGGAWAGPRLGGQLWMPTVTRPQGCNGLSARRMAVLWTFRAPHCVATCAV